MDDNPMLPETAAGEATPGDEGKAAADCISRFPVALQGDAPQTPLDAEIERWFAQHFHDSVASRDTQVFNHCHAAKEDLKRRLATL